MRVPTGSFFHRHRWMKSLSGCSLYKGGGGPQPGTQFLRSQKKYNLNGSVRWTRHSLDTGTGAGGTHNLVLTSAVGQGQGTPLAGLCEKCSCGLSSFGNGCGALEIEFRHPP